jgi:two-component system response regulator HydG
MSVTAAPTKARLLIVDDEAVVGESLGEWFRQDGYDVETVRDGKSALRALADEEKDIALIDIKMPGMTGLELQEKLREAAPDLTVIVMTAYASVETAVQALKAGAYDYITKPFDPDELSHLVARAAEHRSLSVENVRLKRHLQHIIAPSPIIGESAAMAHVQEMIDAVAATDATVLIHGESGTGKELVAHAIHARRQNRFGPLVVVNCGALSESLLESELFGHEKGAFTGAQYRRKGKFELADGGTIFLDEVGAVTPKVQVEMLRVLEEKRVTRLGGQKPIKVDFRVIAATNQDLEQAIRSGQFREDLFWRLNVFNIELPPLRERGQDVLLLSEYFLEQFTRAMNRSGIRLSGEARDALMTYDWPGNVRELRNAIERAVVVGRPPEITVADLPVRVTHRADTRSGPISLEEVERAHIRSVLESMDWNISQAAAALEIDRGTLYSKIRKYGFERPEDAR